MSPDLRELLEDAAHEPVGLPTAAMTWAAGRSRRRVRRVVTATGSAVIVAVVVLGGMTLFGEPGTGPEIVDQPSRTGTPSPGNRADTALPSLSDLAVGSTMALDEGATYESRFPDGTLVRAVDDGVAYPERLYGLDDGTVVWQGASGIHVLGPDEEIPSTLVPIPGSDPAIQSRLVGTGTMDSEPVALIWEDRAASPEDDNGGTLYAAPVGPARLVREVLVQSPSAWELGIQAASLRNGWLLYTVADSGTQTVILRAPDGTETVIEESSGEEHTLQAAELAELDIAPGLAVVEHHVERDDPDAPFGAGRLEIRSVDDPTAAEPAWSIELPTDNVPKQLTVAAEGAYLTLVPDAPELLQVNLHSGDIERFSAPGIVALHARLQPRPSDAPPPAACADSSGVTTADAQAYVWLPCDAAATYAEDDPPARFWGIHKLRLVTDPRASTGGVAQRVEAMIEAIFAGPTPEEQERGYSGIIDPAVDALIGVTFQDGVVTIELTEPGARAASIGTHARAVFQSTVNAAVFGGFVDVDALQITVEGDCVAWSTYGEGPPACIAYHRDGTTTESQ